MSLWCCRSYEELTNPFLYKMFSYSLFILGELIYSISDENFPRFARQLSIYNDELLILDECLEEDHTTDIKLFKINR